MTTINMELLNEVVIRGYQSLRRELSDFVMTRLEKDPLEIYNHYYKNYSNDVIEAALALNIDFLDSATDVSAAKSSIGLHLIEEDIKVNLSKKKRYDNLLKELDIKLRSEEKRITNGIENSEWFKFFGSPLVEQTFSDRAAKLLATCDAEDEYYPKLEKMIENIKLNWKDINPQEPLPDIKKHKFLNNMPVPEGIHNLLTKHTGN